MDAKRQLQKPKKTIVAWKCKMAQFSIRSNVKNIRSLLETTDLTEPKLHD